MAIRFFHVLVLGLTQSIARCDITDTEREALVTEPSSACFGEAVHSSHSGIWSIVAQNHTEYRMLVTIADRGFIHDTTQYFAVLDDKVAVVGRHFLGMAITRLFKRATSGF